MAYVSAARECGPGVEQCELLMLGGAPGKVNAGLLLRTAGVPPALTTRGAGGGCRCGRGAEEKGELGGPGLSVGCGEFYGRKSRRDASGTFAAN